MSNTRQVDPDHMLLCPDWPPFDCRGTFLSLAMAGEAGELANEFKKEWRDGYTQERRTKMISELGDIVAYALMLGAHMDVNIIKEAERSLLGFEQRPEYPELLRKARERTKRASETL